MAKHLRDVPHYCTDQQGQYYTSPTATRTGAWNSSSNRGTLDIARDSGTTPRDESATSAHMTVELGCRF